MGFIYNYIYLGAKGYIYICYLAATSDLFPKRRGMDLAGWHNSKSWRTYDDDAFISYSTYICMAGIESCVYIWQEWIESRVQFLSVRSWGQVFNVCGRLTWDIKRSRSKRERERERDWIERSNIFQQLFCRSRIVAIGAPLWVHHFSLGSMLYVRKTHTTLDTACMLAYRPCPTYNNPSFACRPYIHTVVLIVGMRERERDMNLRLDFVWILCIHPSTREGTMKSTGFLQARCHPSLNASTACTGTAAITEPCSCL